MSTQWVCPRNIGDLVCTIQEEYHSPRLDGAKITVAFEDSKPFLNDQLNLGKVVKFNSYNKLWQSQGPFDFGLILCATVFTSILESDLQKEALIDLLLQRCGVHYVPELIVENGRKKPIKDEYGCVKYTNEIKRDENGNPKWKLLPLDLIAFSKNFARYGLWYDSWKEFLTQAVAKHGH